MRSFTHPLLVLFIYIYIVSLLSNYTPLITLIAALKVKTYFKGLKDGVLTPKQTSNNYQNKIKLFNNKH